MIFSDDLQFQDEALSEIGYDDEKPEVVGNGYGSEDTEVSSSTGKSILLYYASVYHKKVHTINWYIIA